MRVIYAKINYGCFFFNFLLEFKVAQRGEVLNVKILGTIALIDEGKCRGRGFKIANLEMVCFFFYLP